MRLCLVCAVRYQLEREAVGTRPIWTYPDGHADSLWLCENCLAEYDRQDLVSRRREAQRHAARIRRELP